jgi:hypothetical protein
VSETGSEIPSSLYTFTLKQQRLRKSSVPIEKNLNFFVEFAYAHYSTEVPFRKEQDKERNGTHKKPSDSPGFKISYPATLQVNLFIE